MNEIDQYLRISDFAKLCGVTKDTLFHYERIGLLKPEMIMENGYRYYSVKQFFTFDIIAILKETGTSLLDIKSYIENLDTDNFISLLTEKYRVLEEEHIKIKHMKNVLMNTINLTTRAIREICTEPVVEYQDEQYLLVIDFDPDEVEKVRMGRINKHYRYCLDKGLSETLTSGFINNKSSIENRRFINADSYFCEISHKSKNEMFFIKPKGNYALLDHQGYYDTIPETFDKLFAYIEKEKLSVIGNAYIFEILSFLSAKDPDKYILKIAIGVQ